MSLALINWADWDGLWNSFKRPVATPYATWYWESYQDTDDVVVDSVEDGKKARLQISAAGYSAEDLEVSYKDDVLCVSGDNTQNESVGVRFKKSFKKQYNVPESYDPAGSEVKFENGILTILIPIEKEKSEKIVLFGKKT